MTNKFSWPSFLLGNAARNLGRSPRRTIISLLAIAAATATMILFESFVLGVKTKFRENIIRSTVGHYQVFQKGFRDSKGAEPYSHLISDPKQVIDDIRSEVGPVAFASARIDFYGLLSNGEGTVGAQGHGIDAAEESKYLTLARVVEGRNLVGTPESSVFLGVGLATQLRVKVGGSVTLMLSTASGSLNAVDLQIVGTFRTGVTEVDESQFYIQTKEAMKLLRVQGAGSIALAFPVEDELPLGKRLTEILRVKHPQLEAVHWHTLFYDFFENSMGWIEGQFVVFRWIVLVIATLSIANVFTMSLNERTGEFGTLRAIGTYRGEISALIFAESLLQATLGTLLGVLLGIFLIKVVLVGGITMPPPPNMSSVFQVPFQVPWSRIPFNSLICILVAGGSGILPAIRISRINILQALGRNI